MTPREAWFRGRVLGRQTVDRGRAWLRPTWQRSALRGRLADGPALSAARMALARGRWIDAHDALRRHLLARHATFALHPDSRADVRQAILDGVPGAVRQAREAADPVLRGELSPLGYRGLRVGSPPDWHADPVNRRRSPETFWADVPYLDPAVGDHKIIWEVNRHQHWLVLGRAYWLTGDARYHQAFTRELASWLAANPPLLGINWASMLELALRGLSWTWAAHVFADRDDDASPWLVDLLLGLDRQLSHVERNLSVYFSPNTHLLGEALALFVCGHAFPELAASPARIALGRTTLLDGFARQVERDGGHCERSTHYHRYALDFALLALIVARRAGDPASDALRDVTGRLARTARLLADDDGRLPHLGDDDGGRLWTFTDRQPDAIDDSLWMASRLLNDRGLAVSTSVPEEAYWLLGPDASDAKIATAPVPTGPPSMALPDTGYFVSRSPGGDHLVIDAGPHGFLNGGHAHADALALTLSVRRHPLLIDTGTAAYTIDPAVRDRFRATAAHNTVVVDGRSQSEPAGPFHWRTMTGARPTHWTAGHRFDDFEGEHDGYRPVVHRRRVFVLHDDLLVVADHLDGPGTHAASAHWHLAPSWRVSRHDRLLTAVCEGVAVQTAFPEGHLEMFEGDAEAGLGWHSPIYGRIEPVTTVRVTARAPLPLWLCLVVGLDPVNAVVSVRQTPVSAVAGTGRGVGLRIARTRSVDDVVLAEGRGGAWRWRDYESDGRLLFCRRTFDGIVESLLAHEAGWTSVGVDDGRRPGANAAAEDALEMGVV
ncbi:MAG: alginate lyase family protein [Vicinamibacterales bacterium]